MREATGKKQHRTAVLGFALGVVVHSTGVEDEGVWGSIHRHCHGAFGEERLLQSILTAISLHKVTLQDTSHSFAGFSLHKVTLQDTSHSYAGFNLHKVTLQDARHTVSTPSGSTSLQGTYHSAAGFNLHNITLQNTNHNVANTQWAQSHPARCKSRCFNT